MIALVTSRLCREFVLCFYLAIKIQGDSGDSARAHTRFSTSRLAWRGAHADQEIDCQIWLSLSGIIVNNLCLYSLLIPPSLSLSPSQAIMQRRFASSSFTLLLLQWFWDTPGSHIDWALNSVLAWSSFGLLQHLSSAFSPGMSCSVLQEEPASQANESDAYHDFRAVLSLELHLFNAYHLVRIR